MYLTIIQKSIDYIEDNLKIGNNWGILDFDLSESANKTNCYSSIFQLYCEVDICAIFRPFLGVGETHQAR